MIVGAGISAVAAANLLISEGINDIVLLEATDRVGAAESGLLIWVRLLSI